MIPTMTNVLRDTIKRDAVAHRQFTSMRKVGASKLRRDVGPSGMRSSLSTSRTV